MELTPRQVFDRRNTVQLVDVRETEEVAGGMIPGAQHIALGSVPPRLPSTPESSMIGFSPTRTS